MAEIIANGDFENPVVVDDNDPRIRAYDALKVAATKIGRAGYNTSQEIKDIQLAMSDVLGGKITPEEAMSLLHYGATGYVLNLARRA